MGTLSLTRAIESTVTTVEYSTGITNITEVKSEISVFTGYSRTVTTTLESPGIGDTTTIEHTISPLEQTDTVEVDRVFLALMETVSNQLDIEYDADRMDAELYSKVMASMFKSTLDLANKSVQQQPSVDAQIRKSNADAAFVKTQQIELSNSVDFNNKIKALDAYSDLIGTMGAGGLTISENMWTTEFEMIADLNTSGSFTGTPVVSKL